MERYSLTFSGFYSHHKLDRHRGDRYGNDHEGHGYSRHSRGPSRFSDSPVNHHQSRRRSPSSFRVPLSGGPRPFESPPRQGPGGGGGFRAVDSRDRGGDGYGPGGAGGGGGGRGFEQNFEVPPPPAPSITGQKRGFPFSGRGSPDRFDGAGFAKLFVGSVPRTATEEEIWPLFEEHGNVIEVALIKDRRTGQQQGCCFIKYATSEEADKAIRALHNQYTLPGGIGPIQVRYADGERERLGATEYKLFVGSLNKQATEQEVREIFSPYGRVEDVYLMRDEFKQSRGCGFVKYSQRDMALAAINALNGIFTMRGCDQPLIVRFADPKRPRPGDSRGGPTLGGPGFGPRFQPPTARPPPAFNEFSGDGIPTSAWHPMGAPDLAPPSNVNSHGYAGQLGRPNDVPVLQNPNAPMVGPGGPTDGLLPMPAAPSVSMQQQNFNRPFQQFPPGGQQIPPLQKPLQSPQQLTPLKSQPQSAVSYPQNQTVHAQLGQSGHLLSPPLTTSFSQGLPTQQLMGVSGQLSALQTPVQQNSSSATAIQAPLTANLQSQPRPAVANQQHLLAASQQQLHQPLQSPSPLAQMLSQQTQALQASFQSSQQAFSQLQQQLQMMQPSNQIITMQQSSQSANQQSQWGKSAAQTAVRTSATTPSVEVPSSSSAGAPLTTMTIPPVKCSWTEHTSPDGFKYYYNSVTGESRWVEPEELKIFRQPQLQQQKAPAPQAQTQSYPQVLPTQQGQQTQRLPLQPQLQPQLSQQPLQQSQLTSSYQASGALSHQNVQEVGYSQYQVRSHSANDPARLQPGVQAGAQEWMWNSNNKQTALEELN